MKSKSVAETERFAQDFVQKLALGKRATVIGLVGDLGSGKTTFVQFAAKALGVTHHVTSPTFVIMKFYKLFTTHYKLFIHIDAYRLESAQELLDLGWRDIASDPQNLVLVEWADRVVEALPKDARQISFAFIDENTRDITFEHG